MADSETIKGLRELGLYIGVKFDELSQKIDSQESYDDHGVVDAINQLRIELGRIILNNRPLVSVTPTPIELSPITDAIKAIPTPPETESPIPELKLQTDAILSLADAMFASIKDDPKTEKLLPEIKKITTAIASLSKDIQSIEIPKTNFASLEQAIREIPPINISSLEDKIDSVVVAIKKLQPPGTFKIDKGQFQALSGAMRPMGTVGGVLTATGVTQANLSMPLADIEYSYTFPANTLSWMIKLRAQDTLLLYAYQTGTLPTSGTGAKYSTAPQNFLRSIDGVSWGSRKIYVQTGSASQILEIEAYTA